MSERVSPEMSRRYFLGGLIATVLAGCMPLEKRKEIYDRGQAEILQEALAREFCRRALIWRSVEVEVLNQDVRIRELLSVYLFKFPEYTVDERLKGIHGHGFNSDGMLLSVELFPALYQVTIEKISGSNDIWLATTWEALQTKNPGITRKPNNRFFQTETSEYLFYLQRSGGIPR